MTGLNTKTVITVGALLCCVAARAQTATQSPPKGNSATEEVIEMSPFLVNFEQDKSWVATSTLAANRTNQDIAKVPASIDAITSEFIRDLNLGTVEDAANFVTGATSQPRLESRNDDGRISYRGLTSAGTTSRNFFMWYVPSDTYNVDRLDFSLGSNSLMFGDSAPGGQVTVYTKVAQFRNFGEVFGSISSFGTSRYQLDLNTHYKKKLAIRLNAVNRVDSSYIDTTYQRQKAADLAIQYKPFAHTSIRLEGEVGKQIRRRGENALAILDNAAPGLALNQNNRWYYTSDGTIYQRPSTAISGSNTTSANGNAISLLSGQSADVTLPGGIRRTYYGYGRNLNVLGPLDYLDRPYNVFQATINQSIGKLELELAYNQQFQHQQRNDNSFGTTQSPPIMNVDGSGRPFMDMTGTTQYKDFGNIVKAGRISAAYPFTVGNWMKQFVVLSASRQKDFAHNRCYILANEAGISTTPGNTTNTVQNNIITLRAYYDSPAIYTPGFWSQFELRNMPHTATFSPGLIETYANTAPFVDIRYQRNLSLSTSGEYFHGKLSSMAGVSFSRVSRKIPGLDAYKLDEHGFIRDPGLPDQNPGAYVYDAGYDLGARSSMFGLSYELLRRDNFSARLYGVYSQSFNWQSGTTFYGQVLGPILGVTREAGLKGDLFNRSIMYQISVYKIKRQNVAFAWNPDNLSAVQLEDLINPNNLKVGDPGYVQVSTSIVGSERRTVNSNEESTGADFTLQAKRINGLQARVTASKFHVESSPDFTVFQALLASAVERTAAANAAGNTAMAESATNIANAQTIIGSNTLTRRVTGRRSVPYTGSFVLDYETPWIRRLRLGINGTYVPSYNIAVFNGVAYKGGKQFPLNAYAALERKVFRYNCSFRVGIQNLWDPVLGNSEYRKTGAVSFNNAAGTPNYVYRYVDPTTYSASVSVKF